METLDDLKIELESILNIYVNAKIFFQDAEYLHNPDTEKEKKTADRSFFIRRARIAAWRSAIIELCKLYQESRNENYNLIKLLNSLILDYESTEWKRKITKKTIEGFLKEINKPQIQTIRNNIKTMRDTEIAHTDRQKDSENKKIAIAFKEIRVLMELTEKIIQELKSNFFNTHQIFDMPESEKAGGILNIIGKYWELRHEGIIH